MFTLPTEEYKCTGDILCLHCLQRNLSVQVIYIMFTLPTEELKCTGDILCLHCLQRNISAQVIYYVYIAYRGT